MCGIAGSFNRRDFDVARALEAIRHRGPDGDGVVEKGPATHGHVRLALVDLTSASAQPFRRGDGVLSFVGEIWNYRELRSILQTDGARFETTGDTEVLAAALLRWGVDEALAQVEGMFTFAWSYADEHVLVRDRFGKVPLYVQRKGDGFAWASELKAFAGQPAIPLPPGAVLDLTTGAVRTWYELPQEPASPADLDALLAEGVRLRLNADAPLCALISGGLDSSAILTLAHRHKLDIVAYTAVLDPASPDLKAARRVARELCVDLVEVPVRAPGPEDLSAAVRAIELTSKAQVEIAAMCIPLARAIASDGFKACLSGEAADELFGGYGSLCIKGARASDAEWRAIRVSQLEKMGRGNFVRCNKAFMAAGVECRLPFMHRPLVERVINLTKADCPPGKGALKRALAGIVPPFVIKRPKDTFQGAAGMDDAAARAVPDPERFYRAEFTSMFGRDLSRPARTRAHA